MILHKYLAKRGYGEVSEERSRALTDIRAAVRSTIPYALMVAWPAK
jgi:hypothetical protein